MAILEIRKYPDRILKEKTEQVDKVTPDIIKLIDDMVETMYNAPGIGLAANQVGVLKRIAVLDVGNEEDDDSKESTLIVLINPEITYKDGEVDSEEGCLSLPGYTTVVKRAEKVRVKALGRDGSSFEMEAEGLLARALQHEIDHLDSFLLIDRIGRIKREFFKKRYAREHGLKA